MEITTKTFSHIDLELFWNADGELESQVNRQNDQNLKYLNKGSVHTNATFNSIPSGIFNRTVKHNSRVKKKSQMRIDEKYQGHANTLTNAGLVSKIFTSLKEIWRKSDYSKLNNYARR